MAGYNGKIDETYPEWIREIIEKLVKPDPNERADYHEIAKYDEINKHFKNIVGVSEEDKLLQEIIRIDNKIESKKN